MKIGKDRVISISDFYTKLQLEYISYKFRSLIYSRFYDRKKFSDICEKKKLKIIGIAQENNLPSIFNNDDQKVRYSKKFFYEWGLPSFCYRNDYQKKVKGYWDRFYYFVEGSSIKCKVNEVVEIGKIKQCNIEEETLIIQLDNKEVEVNFVDVSRIFPSDFYEQIFK